MYEIDYAGRKIECDANETVLDCLLRNGIEHPYSCRNGSCQTCIMQAMSGEVPQQANASLKPSAKELGYFLPCVCTPQGKLTIHAVAPAEQMQVTVTEIKELGRDLVEVRLQHPEGFEYRPGQFVNLFQDSRTSRCYSLASHPQHDEELVLHVRRLPDGKVSGWIHEALSAGDTVNVSGPLGDSFYVPGQPEQPMMLIGTGTGLAPLYGIVRDALHHGHKGEIRLYHGARDPAGLYLQDELRQLEADHRQFRYIPCVSGADAGDAYAAGRALDVALKRYSDLKGWRVFLCGNPDMVKMARKRIFMAGAAMRDIYADAFTRSTG